MDKIYTRTKSRYKTAADAWQDISKRSNVRPSDIEQRSHTDTHWRFFIKEGVEIGA